MGDKALVMIVDDQKYARETCRMVLKNEYDCLLAESGQECLRLMEDSFPDLIILDNKMPNGWDGMETLRRIREKNSTVPVAVVTAYGSLKNAQQAIKHEVFEYLNKPFDNDELLDVVQRGIAKKRKKEQEEKAVSETMEKMRKNLKESLRLSNIGKLSPSVVHQMKNPLALIIGYSEMLLLELQESKDSGIDSSELKKRLSMIEDQAERCAKMARGLLHLSSTKNGHKIERNLSTITDEIHSLVLPNCMIDNIGLQIDNKSENTLLTLNNNDLHEIILNLLFNAIEAIGQDGTITFNSFPISDETSELIDAEREHIEKNPDHQWIAIEISNDGRPIPPDQIPEIFHHYFTTKGDEGSGLGLSICYEKAQANGGTINLIESDDDITIFRILLPASAQPTTQND